MVGKYVLTVLDPSLGKVKSTLVLLKDREVPDFLSSSPAMVVGAL